MVSEGVSGGEASRLVMHSMPPVLTVRTQPQAPFPIPPKPHHTPPATPPTHVLRQSSHWQMSGLQRAPAWKHSQYFFRHLLRLQRQPRLWPSEAVTCSSSNGVGG
jgi:hypothetical protein